MHSKAVVKWMSELFLPMVVVVAAIVIIILAISSLFVVDVCPKGQENEIFKVMNKAKELKSKPGYEIIYFEVKDCVKEIISNGTILNIQYTTVEGGRTIDYDTGITWANIPNDKISNQGSYPFKVSEDRAEWIGVNG